MHQPYPSLPQVKQNFNPFNKGISLKDEAQSNTPYTAHARHCNEYDIFFSSHDVKI